MKKTISFHEFRDAFTDYGRENKFSYTGLSALWDYLEDLEQAIEEELELDVIGLCEEYTEYKNL